MRSIRRIVSVAWCAGIALALVLVTPMSVRAQALDATVRADDPLRAKVLITNQGREACQIVRSALGTIAVTEAQQNGKDIQPIPIETAFDESLDVLLADKLETLQPGRSAEIPLRIFQYGAGHVLETIAWSADGGSFGLAYPLQASVPLNLTLTYAAPIGAADGAPMCDPAIASTIDRQALSWQMVAGVSIILLLALLVVWAALWQRREAAVVLVVLVAGMAATILPATPARAAYNVPSGIQEQWDACMATLRAHPDITGPILDMFDGPGTTIEIVPTADGTNDTARYADGHYRIYWDPETVRRYYGTGGNSDPCSSLFHELYHAYDMQRGTFSRDDCAGSGIEAKEVMATRAQNQLRERLGLPARSHYGDRALPAGDCTTPPPPVVCDSGHCADTNGDPHLRTFDGLQYDFQAVGEFVAVRSKAGDMEIQVRQTPWPGSRVVSLNTAIAFKVGKNTVEFGLRERKLRMWVNGREKPFAHTTLPGGGEVRPVHDQQGAVMWPDGSVATVRTVGSFGLHMIVDPADSRAGALLGLFGDFDGNPDNDLRYQDSTQTIKPTFDALYPAYADGWRISDQQSLFTYPHGKHTRDYTDRSFPDKPAKADELLTRSAAEVLCRRMGITNSTILANCTLDVAITGRPEFARAARVSQRAHTPAVSAVDAQDVSITQPNGVGRLRFEAKAGEKVFIDVQAEVPDQCGVLELFGPDNRQVTSGCIIGKRGMIDGTVLPAEGTYTLVVDPDGPATGQAKARLLRIVDKQVEAKLDGPAQSATIDKPGVVAVYRFTAKAGQRIFVDMPSAKLPDQCSPLTLYDANSQQLASGCIIGGKGYIDTTTIPADGTYTIQVDPATRHVGTVSLQIITTRQPQTTLTINGSEQRVNLDRPGSVARMTIKGTAGQRLYVRMTNSSLPDRCGVVLLESPDGKRLSSGCIIGGKGDLNTNGVILPATGEYTLTIDPISRTTGKVTVRAYTK